jgi:hypothetical protein
MVNACSSRRPITFCRERIYEQESVKIQPLAFAQSATDCSGDRVSTSSEYAFILGQTPSVIEIDDTTTLFVPFPRINVKRIYPQLLGLDGIYHSGFPPLSKPYWKTKAVEGSSATSGLLPTAFRSCFEIQICLKRSATFHGYASLSFTRTETDGVTILFTKSWHQGATGFYLAAWIL